MMAEGGTLRCARRWETLGQAWGKDSVKRSSCVGMGSSGGDRAFRALPLLDTSTPGELLGPERCRADSAAGRVVPHGHAAELRTEVRMWPCAHEKVAFRIITELLGPDPSK